MELPIEVSLSGQIKLSSMFISDDFFVTDFTSLMKAINHDQQRIF
jgi:hypothetical protein